MKSMFQTIFAVRKVISFWAFPLVFLLATACGKESMEIPIRSISMEETLSLEVGESSRLTVEITPANTTESTDVAWSSSDKQVVTVDESGQVQALQKGEAIVTATLKVRPVLQVFCTVTVTDEPSLDRVITFEDAKFGALALFYDTNNDGQLQVSEAQAVRELNISSKGIASLQGIEYFTSLEQLDCSMNSLTSLDVSKNSALKRLYCQSNRIASLDVSALSELQVLNCSSNRLREIDVTHNPELVIFSCSMNSGSMEADSDGITEIDVTQNPKLEELEVYYLNISSLDVTHNPKLRKLNMGYCCHTRWHDLTPVEELDLSQNPELEELDVTSSNYPGFGLSSLDVTHNPKLRRLVTYGNPKIASLDLSGNPLLTSLNCCHNSLTVLDVTKCPKIDTLSCQYNSISELDLTSNTELVYLNCADNQIGALDLSQTKLGYLLAQNNRISTIDMGDKTFDTQHPNDQSEQAGKPYLYMKLNNNLIEQIDLSRQTYLHWLEIDNNRLSSLDVSVCIYLGGLYCRDNQLTSLALGDIHRLWELRVSGNQLSGRLDLSGFSPALSTSGHGLTRLSAENNQLAEIVVWDGFDPDATYFLGGTGILPCYTKDASTVYVTE